MAPSSMGLTRSTMSFCVRSTAKAGTIRIPWGHGLPDVRDNVLASGLGSDHRAVRVAIGGLADQNVDMVGDRLSV